MFERLFRKIGPRGARAWTGVAAVLLLGVAGFAALAYRPAIAPIRRPSPASFGPSLVARGETLAAGAYCGVCHTASGGAPLAGGLAMKTDYGVIYSTNITPDPETGIGAWSLAAFRRALREGVARDGAHLFPAFPYDHFTKLSDADVEALYAWAMTRPAVHAPARTNALPFPLNVRTLQAGWKLLFFRPGRFQPSPAHDAQWNRGAYLAEALGHCGACHTPRNFLGAEQHDRAYAGAVVDAWIAPALTRANPSPAPWTSAELSAYLSQGASPLHGVVAGPMSPVVHQGLAKLPEADQRAIVAYIADIGGGDARASEIVPAVSRALAIDQIGVGAPGDADARLYTAACASCHYNSRALNPARPDLSLNSAVSLKDPANLIHVILYGVRAGEGSPGVVMPGFASGFSDADVARIAAYLRRTRTSLPPWPDLDRKVAAIRAKGPGE